MPNAYDPRGRQLVVTHNPVARIPVEPGKLKPFDYGVVLTSVLEQIVELIKDATGIDLTEFLTVFDQLSLDFSSPEAFISSAIQALIALPDILFDLAMGLVSSGAGLLGIGSLIPYSHVADFQPNLLLKKTFDHATDIEGADADWSHDPDVGHSDLGSARVGADGTLLRLESKTNMAVAVGQQLTVSVWARWLGLVFTGRPVKLQLVRYFDGMQVGVSDVASAPEFAPTDQDAWVRLEGTFTVPDGCDMLRLQVCLPETVTAGTVWFDDAEAKKTGLMAIPWISGLPQELQEGLTRFQNLLDTIWQAVSGLFGVDKVLEDVAYVLRNIPFLNILGIGGPVNIGESIQATWDRWISGLVGVLGGGTSLADLFNVGQEVSSRATRGAWSYDILGVRNNNSFFNGFFQSSKSNLRMDSLAFNRVSGTPTAPTVPITQSTALTEWHNIEQNIDIGMISWIGSGVASMTGFFVNIWQMDPTTGNVTLRHHSANQIGLLSGTLIDTVYDLPEMVSFAAGDIMGVELHPIGGTHNVVGDQTWRNFSHPLTVPRRWSSKRNGGTSTAAPSPITDAAMDYATTYVPFIEYGVSSSVVPLPHSPESVYFQTVGSEFRAIPDWCNFIDRIVVGSGGGGAAYGGASVGGGGGGGNWASDTLERDVDIPRATNLLQIIIGAGGAPGGSSGANGASCQVIATGASTLIGTGGVGGVRGESKTGRSPGNHIHNGVPYVGGAAQFSSGPGNPPGGGGPGASSFFMSPEAGAPGAVWVVFRQ